MEAADGQSCVPEEFAHTVNEKELKKQLVDSNVVLMRNLIDSRDGKQYRFKPFVCAIRLGSGFGKTHILVKAPTLLGAKSVYITYNQDQSLVADKADPRACILLRVILRCWSFSNKGCDDFLNTPDGILFRSLPIKQLTELVVYVLQNEFPNQPVVIGVDETASLSERGRGEGSKIYPCVEKVISTLGNLALAYFTATSQMCTVLVTSLVGATFRTPSTRPVLDVYPKKLDIMGIRELTVSISPAGKEEIARHCAILMSLAGAHFRSVVMVERKIVQLTNPTFAQLYEELEGKVVRRGDANLMAAIRAYVISLCREPTGVAQVPEGLEEYVDNHGVVPSVFIWAAFLVTSALGAAETTFHEEHPLWRFFDTCAFKDSAKQLEICAAHFDIFRAQNGLPVVPGSMSVCFPTEWNGCRERYQNLSFPTNLKLDERALFETRQAISTDQKKTNEIVFLGNNFKVGSYYHPACEIHPWVDRACIVLDNEGDRCVVLYQDKINNDLPKAVAGLNSAAKLMHAAGWERVLCVAHVVDASDQTRVQNTFDDPYVLIRNDQLNDYYSLHFAPAIRYVRARHQL
eukprot:scaffold25570_cov43-Attheya_sp.AAC.1